MVLDSGTCRGKHVYNFFDSSVGCYDMWREATTWGCIERVKYMWTRQIERIEKAVFFYLNDKRAPGFPNVPRTRNN